MKKIVLVCGGIAGLISIFWGILSVNFVKGLSMNMSLLLGYAAMVLGFSLIFVGVKNYRDNYNGGVISFGQALKVSLLITLVASTVYVLIWEIDFYVFLPDFGKHYMDMVRADMVAKGASAAKIQQEMNDMKQQFQDYNKPLNNVLMTYCEILPVGILISLIASLILMRKTKRTPATA